MRRVEFVPFRLTDVAEIFSIRIEGELNSELKEFIITFKDIPDEYLKGDFNSIIRNLIKISENGAAESMFRPEGSIRDRVCALPLYSTVRDKKHGTLRLYCIRISDNLLIVGGGGIKTTRTYEEDEVLSEKVKTLQLIDRELAKLEDNGTDLNKGLYNITLQID